MTPTGRNVSGWKPQPAHGPRPELSEDVKRVLRAAWEWDWRNFPPYGSGVLPERLR